jgi:hypothetical protein
METKKHKISITALNTLMEGKGYKLTIVNDDNDSSIIVAYQNDDHQITLDVETYDYLITLKKDLPSTAERIAERERVRQLFKDILS